MCTKNNFNIIFLQKVDNFLYFRTKNFFMRLFIYYFCTNAYMDNICFYRQYSF